MSSGKRLAGLRGACQCLNEEEDICKQVAELYNELLSRNRLPEKDIVSIIFSMTEDLNAKNPAAALRQAGRAGEASLFAVQEAKVIGSLERTIRILIHCYLEEDQKIVHVYRNGAEVLRPDRK